MTTEETQEPTTKLVEFSEKTQVKIQKLVYELTKVTLYGATIMEIDSLCEMAYKTLDRPHRELASSIDVMCNAVLRVFHGLNDITALTPQILEGLKPYAPACDWTRYCCRHVDLPDVGEETDVCGHLSVIESLGRGKFEAELKLLHDGEVKLVYTSRDDWLACRPTGDTSNPVFFQHLVVDLNDSDDKILIWISGKSKVIGGAPK